VISSTVVVMLPTGRAKVNIQPEGKLHAQCAGRRRFFDVDLGEKVMI
jgi:hypothetical protein